MWVLGKIVLYGLITVSLLSGSAIDGCISARQAEKVRTAYIQELLSGLSDRTEVYFREYEEEQAAKAAEEKCAAQVAAAAPAVEYDTGIVTLEGNASRKDGATVYNYYRQIPENVRNRFESDGWQLILTTNNFGAQFGYYGKYLAFSYMGSDRKVMYIDDRPAAMDAVLHEMGHVIDWTSCFVSYTSEFSDIYSEEVGTFCLFHSTNKSNYDTTLEYFAESYQVCLQHPEQMQQYCPRTYAYVMQYANAM